MLVVSELGSLFALIEEITIITELLTHVALKKTKDYTRHHPVKWVIVEGMFADRHEDPKQLLQSTPCYTILVLIFQGCHAPSLKSA